MHGNDFYRARARLHRADINCGRYEYINRSRKTYGGEMRGAGRVIAIVKTIASISIDR